MSDLMSTGITSTDAISGYKKLHVLSISAFLLCSFFLVVVFDPSDSLTGLKKYIFFALMSWWLLQQFITKKPPQILPSAMWITAIFGLFFPLLSIISYYIQGGDFVDYEGFSNLIGFLSLTLLILITSMKELSLKLFRWILTVEVFMTVFLYLILSILPDFTESVTLFGYAKGFLWINAKSYGDFQFLQIFFKTAPFMVLPTAYYADRYFNFSNTRNARTLFMLSACCLALLISGTRANMVIALFIPAYFGIRSLLFASFTQKILFFILLFILFVFLLTNIDIILAMLDPEEFSNNVKLGYLNDYMRIFSDPIVLLLGQGIGVIHHFESLGLDLQITEVTLLELVRNFGLIIATGYIAFWIAPLILLRQDRLRQYRWLRVGYASYLLISMSNYFILSSTGMVLLSVVYCVCLRQTSHSDLPDSQQPISTVHYSGA